MKPTNDHEELSAQTVAYLSRPNGESVAYCDRVGAEPALVFVPGFNSVMTGQKARAVDDIAKKQGLRCIRFDYQGHGASTGDLKEGSVEIWRDDVLALLDHLSPRRILLVGSSMGVWISLLLARELGKAVIGVVGIGGAADFTKHVVERLSAEQRASLAQDGIAWRPSRYGDGPYPLTTRMIEQGNRQLILGRGLKVQGPLTLLHGTEDPDAPWERAMDILQGVDASRSTLTLIKGGDHRLSTPEDLRAMEGAVLDILAGVCA